MQQHTLTYVLVTDVFQNCHLLWEEFCNVVSAGECNFGSNNRSLITAERLSYLIDNYLQEYPTECDLVMSRLEKLPPDMYVDLEN